MAAAVLSKACCMRVCTSPGRPLHGQEVSVATCPAAPTTPFFALFLKKKQCRDTHWDTPVLGGLWSVPSGTQ